MLLLRGCGATPYYCLLDLYSYVDCQHTLSPYSHHLSLDIYNSLYTLSCHRAERAEIGENHADVMQNRRKETPRGQTMGKAVPDARDVTWCDYMRNSNDRF